MCETKFNDTLMNFDLTNVLQAKYLHDVELHRYIEHKICEDLHNAL